MTICRSRRKNCPWKLTGYGQAPGEHDLYYSKTERKNRDWPGSKGLAHTPWINAFCNQKEFAHSFHRHGEDNYLNLKKIKRNKKKAGHFDVPTPWDLISGLTGGLATVNELNTSVASLR